MPTAVAIFGLTYAAIAAGKVPFLSIDRPAAALIGAVLMVGAGVLGPGEAARAINGDTIALLLGTMVLTSYLAEAGFFRWSSWHVLRLVRSPRALLWAVALVAGLLSAFLVNDTVCLLVAPLVLDIVDEAELPPLPYLLALAFGANAGSAATLTGNPQNMIIGALSGLPYTTFAAACALPAAAATLTAAAFLHVVFRRKLPRRAALADVGPPRVEKRLLWTTLVITALVIAGFAAGYSLSWTALAGAAACFAAGRRSPRAILVRVDWPLLVFFAGLFVVVAGVERAGVTAALHDRSLPFLAVGGVNEQVVRFATLATVASQVVSNVPFVLVAAKWIPGMADPQLMWTVLALASTLAGNLTVIGSVANVIVLESAGERVRVGFWRFLAYGAPVTVATLAISLGLLLLLRGGIPPHGVVWLPSK
ncbi:MAG TPA: SLC13 family permease [Anaeromyxobacteraceae bacterium]|nr:SLC13 family permease [Anaeromyxobacteraceae bacterium]